MYEAIKKFPNPSIYDSGWVLVGLISLYDWYYVISKTVNHFTLPSKMMSGDCIRGIYIFVCIIVAIITAPYAWWIIILVSRIFVSFYLGLRDIPDYVKQQLPLLKRIWSTSGFLKYKAFGGLTLYVMLRTRVLAFLFAFISVGILTWFFIYKQYTYKWDYRKIRFYYGEQIEPIKFYPNTYYTFESSSLLYAIYVNGRMYSVGEQFVNDAYGRQKFNPEKKDLYLPDTWNIKFSDTVKVQFVFYTEPIHQIFAQSFELWANKQLGKSVELGPH